MHKEQKYVSSVRNGVFIVLAAFVCVLFAGLTAGPCLAWEEPANKGTTTVAEDVRPITVWTGFDRKEQETLETIAHKYWKEQGVPVRFEHIRFFDLKTRFQEIQKKGEGPDIFIGPNDWIGELARQGAIAPLEKNEFGPELQKNFNPTGIKAVTFDNKIYGIPFYLEAMAIVYNKNLVKEEPKTMEDLLKTASAFNDQKAGKFGFLFEYQNLYASWPFFAGFGSELFAPNATPNGEKVLLDSAGTVKALQFLAKIETQYKLFPGEMTPDEIEQVFAAGKVQFCLTGPWALKKFRRSFVNYGVIDFPTLENGQRPRSFVGVHAFMLNANCRNRAQAVDFMQYLNSDGNQLAFCSIDNRIPGRLDTLASIKEYPEIATFAKIAEHGVPVPNVPGMAYVWEPMSTAVKQVVEKDGDPEKILKEKVTAIQKLIDKMNRK